MKKIDLLDPNIVRLINKYSEEILKVVDNQDEYTRSDLQGVVDAIVMNILRAGLDLS